ncbi:putative carboxypeptidase X1 [Glandiceps talaboti]
MKFIFAFVVLLLAVTLSKGFTCEAGWISFADSCYYVSEAQLYSFGDAKRLCEITGASLVTINDADENLFLNEFVCDNLWIGLNDIGQEGHFEWVSGEESTYRNWDSGQPDNYGHIEHCVHLVAEPVGKWNDNECSTHMGYICEKSDDEEEEETECLGVPVGVESGLLPDSQMTASTTYTSVHMPYYGRLNWCELSGVSCAWCGQNKVDEWLQIDLGYSRKVTGVDTQGRDNASLWVTSFKLSYGDGSTWQFVNDHSGQPKTYSANTDKKTIIHHELEADQIFTARYVRFVVQTWYGHICMRVEVYACE